ncbi:hypothetical protein I317_04528 [Kwoniella heveanensis CBS 569]|nr:hypothetical protein I317_04528 [Kwoniella heveanensis CBS 569]
MLYARPVPSDSAQTAAKLDSEQPPTFASASEFVPWEPQVVCPPTEDLDDEVQRKDTIALSEVMRRPEKGLGSRHRLTIDTHSTGPVYRIDRFEWEPTPVTANPQLGTATQGDNGMFEQSFFQYSADPSSAADVQQAPGNAVSGQGDARDDEMDLSWA